MRTALIGIFLVGFSLAAWGQSPQALSAVAGQALLHSSVNADLQQLSDTIGGRVTGSPAAAAAIEWAQQKMRAAGLEDVHAEPWTLEHGWRRVSASGRLLGAGGHALTLSSMGWTGSTPTGGVDGDVVEVNSYQLKQVIANDTGNWRGKILMLRPKGARPKNGLEAFTELDPFLRAAYKAGAVGVLGGQGAGASAGMNLTHTGVLGFNTVYDIPVVNLREEDQLQLERDLDAGLPVRLHLDVENVAGGPTPSANVVGEVRGSKYPDQVIVVGGHLDSWDLSEGSTDDGTGAMAAMAAVEALAHSGVRPLRTVRVVLFTGEEQGLLGSLAYTARHAKEMDKTVAALILDEGQGPISDMEVGGHEGVIPKLQPLLKMLAGFGAPTVNDDSSFDTDSGPFTLSGSVGINLGQDSPDYRYTHHSEVDSFDHVRQDVLVRNTAELAVMAAYIADLPDRLDAAWSPDQVAAKLKQQHLEQELRAFGLWRFGN
ncbi:MAG: M20/M25/M40 family metallo-hydrolase [Terriglobales bacterium]